jgi:hypothetical protein
MVKPQCFRLLRSFFREEIDVIQSFPRRDRCYSKFFIFLRKNMECLCVNIVQLA